MSTSRRRAGQLLNEVWRLSLPMLEQEQLRQAFGMAERQRAGEVTWLESEEVARAVLRHGWRRARLKTDLGAIGQPVANMTDEELDEVEARLAILDSWLTTEEERDAAVAWLAAKLVENGKD